MAGRVTINITLQANAAVMLLEASIARISLTIQNQGPGILVLKQNSQPTAISDGIQLSVGGLTVDSGEDIHRGRWWGMADTNNTVAYVAEGNR